MWLLIVCAMDGWAAGTPADSAWVQDTGGISYRAALTTPPLDTNDTGDTADSADSADSGDSGDTGSVPTDGDADTDVDADSDADADTDADTDADEDVGCCNAEGNEASMILGVGLALAVVLGRRRLT